MSIHRALPHLFAFDVVAGFAKPAADAPAASEGTSSETEADDEAPSDVYGEAQAIRVLYQLPAES